MVCEPNYKALRPDCQLPLPAKTGKSPSLGIKKVDSTGCAEHDGAERAKRGCKGHSEPGG